MSAPSRRHLLALVCLVLAACRQDMHDQPKYQPDEPSPFFADGRASRPQVAGTVARGQREDDEHFLRGRLDGELAEAFPLAIDRALLERGRERYGIFCAPCHGPVGDGDGMIVRRGMKRPPSFHVERLHAAPAGYLFDVMTRGFGTMYSYDDRVSPSDRWAIAAWIRVLQRSQRVTLDELSDEVREALMATRAAGEER